MHPGVGGRPRLNPRDAETGPAPRSLSALAPPVGPLPHYQRHSSRGRYRRVSTGARVHRLAVGLEDHGPLDRGINNAERRLAAPVTHERQQTHSVLGDTDAGPAAPAARDALNPRPARAGGLGVRSVSAAGDRLRVGAVHGLAVGPSVVGVLQPAYGGHPGPSSVAAHRGAAVWVVRRPRVTVLHRGLPVRGLW